MLDISRSRSAPASGLRRHLPSWIATGEVVRRRNGTRNSEVLEPSTPLPGLEAGAGIDDPASQALRQNGSQSVDIDTGTGQQAI